VALAAILARKWDPSSETGTDSTAVVLSGGNVSLSRIQRLTGT